MILQGVGLVGVVLMLVAYGLTISNRMDARATPALVMNLSGSLMVLASLWQDWNLPAAVIESAWAMIALAGLVRPRRA